MVLKNKKGMIVLKVVKEIIKDKVMMDIIDIMDIIVIIEDIMVILKYVIIVMFELDELK